MRSTPWMFTALLALALPGLAMASGLSVTKTVSPNPAPAGAPVTWTLRVLNSNPSAARDVNLRDSLPAGVTAIAASSDVFACSVADLTVQCAAAELPAGISIITISGIAPKRAAAVLPVATAGRDEGSRPNRPVKAAVAAAPAPVVPAADPMETIANLRLTIGKLEGEREVLVKRATDAEESLGREVENGKRLAGELEEGRVKISDLEARTTAAEGKVASLTEQLGKTAGDGMALQEQLKVLQDKLDASNESLTTGQASEAALRGQLARAEAQLFNGEPLTFAVDCPAEASSQKWLLANLPVLLEAAMANPTPQNARAFLCAQRAATTHGDFGRQAAASNGAFIPNTTSSITDGKLRMHRTFPNSPSPVDIENLRKDAMRGSAEALNDLGVLSLVGEGVPFDQALAERNLSAAAAGGSALAAANLAVMFDRGVGVTPDAPAATQWRRFATSMGRKGS